MADERFQDFPQKTNPSGSDELVGVDGSGYFRAPVSSLPSGGDSLPEFFKFMVGDKVLIVQTGQSNPQGLEARRAAAGVDTWENNRVWDWQWSDRTTVQQDYTNFADSRWDWVNPTTTQTVALNWSAALMYMGYIGGNTGNQVYALANEVQLSTGLDVYVVNLCQGGASIEWWETPTVFGINMAEVLQDALQYILAGSTGIDFQSKPGPDIVSWGQSEANMPAPMGTYPTTPDDWAQRLDVIFNLARSQTESWVAEGYSKIFLTEATDYVNWDGVPAPGSYAGCPYQWDGANVAGTIYGDDIVLVSSRGIEHGNGVDTSMVTAAPVAQAGNPTYLVHYSGDGNDAYGRRIADIVLSRSREFKDTDLDVENGNMNDRVTALEEGGGSSLNAVQKYYGIGGDHFQTTSHFTDSEIAFSTSTDDTLFGIEPILCNVSGGSTVSRSNLAPLELGVAAITASGALERSGVQVSKYPTTIANSTTGFTLSVRCSPYTDQTPGTERYYFRVGWQRPFTDANDDQGVFFEHRFGEPNWRAVAIGDAGPTADEDTGVPVTLYTVPFGTPNGMIDMILKVDLVANTAEFTINSTLTNTIDLTGMDFTFLASLGVLIKNTEAAGPATGFVDFIAADIYADFNVSGLI